MNYAFNFSDSVIFGIRDIMRTSLSSADMEKTVRSIYGENAVTVARQIALEEHTDSWLQIALSDDGRLKAESSSEVSKSAIEPYLRLRGKFTFSQLEDIRWIVKESSNLVEMEELVIEKFGTDALLIARNIASCKRVFERKAKEDTVEKAIALDQKPCKDIVSANEISPLATDSQGKENISGNVERLADKHPIFQYIRTSLLAAEEKIHDVLIALSKIAVTIAFLFGVAILWDHWSKYRAERDHEAEKQKVGELAENAAGVWIIAYEQCNLIGLPNVNECAYSVGILPEQTLGKELALAAINSRDNYQMVCIRYYDSDYCSSILTQAWTIKKRMNSRR